MHAYQYNAMEAKMAENKDTIEQDKTADEADKIKADQAPSKKGSLKLIIAASVGGLFIVGLAVTTIVLLLSGESKAPIPQANIQTSDSDSEKVAQAEPAAERVAPVASSGEPQFFPIRPAIVVNIPSKSRIRFLQIQVDIMSRDSGVIDDLENYVPLIKNELVSLFSSQTYEDVISQTGRDNLRKEALLRVQKIMSEQAGVVGIEQILFTSFVTQ